MRLKKVKQNSNQNCSIYQNRLYHQGGFFVFIIQNIYFVSSKKLVWARPHYKRRQFHIPPIRLLSIMRSGYPGYFGSFLLSLSQANRNRQQLQLSFTFLILRGHTNFIITPTIAATAIM
jgi:hypothetical protein